MDLAPLRMQPEKAVGAEPSDAVGAELAVDSLEQRLAAGVDSDQIWIETVLALRRAGVAFSMESVRDLCLAIPHHLSLFPCNQLVVLFSPSTT